MSAPLVIKFGGDALASPERIAAAARRVRLRLTTEPVVAVASARRGVTDHLLGLVERVRAGAAGKDDTPALFAASDRAVAAGELVAASLLAVALGGLGIKAQVLDAREAGLGSDGQWTRAQLTRVQPGRILKLLQRGITPVVAGFQGWHRGRVTTLGRGGSDTTAVALAAALGSARCELVKQAGGLLTADPKLVPEARHIPRASHRFLTALAAAGAKVISYRGAGLAECEGVALRFTSLEGDITRSEVSAGAEDSRNVAVASRSGRYRFTAHVPRKVNPQAVSAFLAAIAARGIPAELEITGEGSGSRIDLLADPVDLETCRVAAKPLLPRGRQLALIATGLTTVTALGAAPDSTEQLHGAAHSVGGAQVLRTSVHHAGVSFLVPDDHGAALARALHAVLWNGVPGSAPDPTQVNPQQNRRIYVGHR